ncbi:MAG TPA: hypothetical protein DD706_06895 [Nitrospiraceae bacterium]|nr:hypothetical protein [Nitrospiraceae bacterium]
MFSNLKGFGLSPPDTVIFKSLFAESHSFPVLRVFFGSPIRVASCQASEKYFSQNTIPAM